MFKKLGALLLALTLTLSLCAVPATAAASDFEIKDGVLIKYTGSGGAVAIPADVTEIKPLAFFECIWLTSVTIPDSVTAIDARAFSGCTNLTNVTIPNSVTKIDEGAFEDTPWLKSLGDLATVNHILLKYHGAGGAVIIPNDVAEISNYAFSGCTNLTSITIPNSVITIGYCAFRGCTGLTSVTIGNGVTEISNYAFSGCTNLTSVTIPNSVTTIGVGAFEDTPWLKSLGDFAIVNNILLAYQGTDVAPAIPGSVTTIGGDAFYNCDELTSVTIPSSVTTIGDSAFSRCDQLNSVTIPNSVTTIGERAFYCCTGLTGVTIPDSVTAIAAEAFSDCPNLTLHGVQDSYAQTYAKENSIPFVVGKAPTVLTAYAAPQTVLVDGKEVQFTAYALKDANGNLTNYFRVRDIASILNGTAAQFAVTWDGAVNLKAKTAYTADGSEMTVPLSGNQPYKQIAGDTLVSGVAQKLAAITLTDAKGGGYTYYKLRDLGSALGFKVDWNGKNVTIATAP